MNIIADKMKKQKQKYDTAEIVPKSNRKIVGREKGDTLYTQIHDRSLRPYNTNTLPIT